MKTAFLCVRRTALAFAAFALFASSFARAATATATAGQTATLTVTADGTTPFTYQWTLNGANIAGATAATYVISNVKLTDAATYSVVVSNSAGSTTSDNAALTVVPAASAPTFTTQPASQTVTAGSAVTFAALASGSPAPAYQWQMNGMNIPGATGTSYTITNTGLSNAGSYTLVASNTAGSATSSGAALAVNTVPTITTQPTNQTVNVGQSATFAIAGSGNPLPAYQWQQSVDGGTTWAKLANGTAFSGVTTSALLVGSAPASANNSQFRCLITNSTGTVTSDGFVLTVIVPPSSLQISIQIN
jgi:hypothetical protein